MGSAEQTFISSSQLHQYTSSTHEMRAVQSLLLLAILAGVMANQRPVSRSRDHFLSIRGQYPGIVTGVMTNKRPVFRSRPQVGKLVVLPEARPVIRQRLPSIGNIVVLPETRKFFGNQMRANALETIRNTDAPRTFKSKTQKFSEPPRTGLKMFVESLTTKKKVGLEDDEDSDDEESDDETDDEESDGEES